MYLDSHVMQGRRSSGSTSLCSASSKGGNKLYLIKTHNSKGASCMLKGSERCCTFKMVVHSSRVLQVDRGTEILSEPNIRKHQQSGCVVGINTQIHPLDSWLAEIRHTWGMIHLSLKPTSQVRQCDTLNTSTHLHCLGQELVVAAPQQTLIMDI